MTITENWKLVYALSIFWSKKYQHTFISITFCWPPNNCFHICYSCILIILHCHNCLPIVEGVNIKISKNNKKCNRHTYIWKYRKLLIIFNMFQTYRSGCLFYIPQYKYVAIIHSWHIFFVFQDSFLILASTQYVKHQMARFALQLERVLGSKLFNMCTLNSCLPLFRHFPTS